ncbi:BatA domain-containing protein [Melioribacter sp. OK-6-Me]|uniref:BatA domain-containing protein n=1 Tax=unclassified Melioribacter TaxID=2627329 RepID=UPI003ED86328
MTFLNPAILIGLLAAGIPVIIHFLNLKKLKKVEFSTLTFLKELQKSKIRKIKFRQWLLLLIRVMIIIFLVLAFARPTIKGTVAESGTTSAIFIFDDSYSMSLVTPQGSLFNISKKFSKEISSSFSSKDRIAVMKASEHTNRINFVPPSEALKLVDGLNVSVKSVKLNDALSDAINKLKSETSVNKEIFVFSDFQKSAFKLPDKSPDEKIKIYAITLGAKNSNNLSVDTIYTENQIFELNKSVSFLAVIKNHSESQAVNRIASLYINGRRTAQKGFSIAPKGRTILNFETVLIDTGIINVQVSLEDDDILFDNYRYLAIYVPGKIRVLILSEKKEDGYYLNAALSTSLTNKNQTVILEEMPYAALTSIDLKKYNTIISIGAPEASQYGLFSDYVYKGGNLVLFPSSFEKLENHEKFCNSLGIRGKGFQKISNSIHYTGNLNYDHPLITDLFENKKNVEIESPEFYRYFRLNGFYEGEVIIAMDDGSPFVAEIKKGAGKIFLFNIAPVTNWSNFPLKSIFAPLINRISRFKSNFNTEKEFRTGERIIIDLAGIASPIIKVDKPDNTVAYLNRNESPNQNIISYTDTDLPGLYQFYADTRLIKYAVVNTDPFESIPDYYTDEELKAGAGFITINSTSFKKENIIQLRYGSELWKYFVILVILLATIETFLSKSNKREVIDLEKGS